MNFIEVNADRYTTNAAPAKPLEILSAVMTIIKVLIFGSESKGIRPLILKNCDFKTKICLNVEDKRIESLNVSNCVSIALFECLKK